MATSLEPTLPLVRSPDPTVRGLDQRGHDLGGAQLDVAYIEAQLGKLEKLLRINLACRCRGSLRPNGSST